MNFHDAPVEETTVLFLWKRNRGTQDFRNKLEMYKACVSVCSIYGVLYVFKAHSLLTHTLFISCIGVSVPIKSAQVISIPGANGLTDSSWKLSFSILNRARKGREIADGFRIYLQMVVEEGYDIPSTFSGLWPLLWQA